jgi:hypothetical protein
VAYGINIAVVIAFGVWSIVDTWFWPVSRVMGARVGLLDPLAVSMQYLWTHLSSRVAVFTGLAVVGGLSFLIVVSRLFIGRSSGRSLCAWMASVALIAMWTSIALSTNCDTGATYRVSRDLHQFQEVVAGIRETEFAGQTQWIAGYRYLFDSVSPQYPEQPSVHEPIAMCLSLDAGAYLFLLKSRRYTIEHHPSGTIPKNLPSGVKDVFPLGDLKESTYLGDGWFLTRYVFPGD